MLLYESMFQVSSIGDFPRLAGVYKFTNLSNGKVYIGETGDMKDRMYKYKYKRKTKEIHLISRALHKYGFEGFRYEVLESFPLGISKEILLDREEFWIRFYNATDKTIGYNIVHRGVNQTGIKRSPEVREKMRLSKIGFKHSDETKKKMSASRMGEKNWNWGRKGELSANFGKKMPKEHLEKLRKRNSQPKPYAFKKVNQIDLKSGEIIKTWNSIGDAAEGVRGNRKKYHGISHTLNGGQNQAFGFGWSYANNS